MHPMIADLASEPVLIIVLIVVVLVFGSTRLPKLARSLGSASSEFKKGQQEGMREQAEAEAAKNQSNASDSNPSGSSGGATSQGSGATTGDGNSQGSGPATNG
jgi:sec-independent protein translocase protein TatA